MKIDEALYQLKRNIKIHKIEGTTSNQNEREKTLLDYITNLQKEVENLREDNYAYHQLMKIQNKREYRSKFLKEFQEEFGTNTFPDYDEIYKRYDKVKKENEKLKEIEKEHKNCTRKHWQQKCAEHYANEMIYKQRNEKAIEYIKQNSKCGGSFIDDKFVIEYIDEIFNGMELLNILKGSDG